MTQTYVSHIHIIGAGVLGRWLTITALKRGHQVSLFDQGEIIRLQDISSVSLMAGGMCSPMSEWEKSSDRVFELGLQGLSLWEEQAVQWPSLEWQRKGTLVLEHPKDKGEFQRFSSILKKKIEHKTSSIPSPLGHDVFQDHDVFRVIHGPPQEWEQELDSSFRQSLFLPHEGVVHPESFFKCTNDFFLEQQSMGHLTLYPYHPMSLPHLSSSSLSPNYVLWATGWNVYSKQHWPTLRGVRGEIVTVHAPQVTITRPIRWLHPRYPIYIIPRGDHRYTIGATQIESEDSSPIKVRSLLELLSVAYDLHKGFGEANLIKQTWGLRPTLPDHNPQWIHLHGNDHHGPKEYSINGLYRHGYLCAPALAEEVLNLCNS